MLLGDTTIESTNACCDGTIWNRTSGPLSLFSSAVLQSKDASTVYTLCN